MYIEWRMHVCLEVGEQGRKRRESTPCVLPHSQLALMCQLALMLYDTAVIAAYALNGVQPTTLLTLVQLIDSDRACHSYESPAQLR
jgi:hypothetical protein